MDGGVRAGGRDCGREEPVGGSSAGRRSAGRRGGCDCDRGHLLDGGRESEEAQSGGRSGRERGRSGEEAAGQRCRRHQRTRHQRRQHDEYNVLLSPSTGDYCNLQTKGRSALVVALVCFPSNPFLRHRTHFSVTSLFPPYLTVVMPLT